MNTDYLIQNSIKREKDLTHILDSNNIPCSKVNKYAYNQNTIYDGVTNQILYGVNNHMHALGVADGTCNLINPYIFEQKNICGLGSAGGNPCVADAYGIKNIMRSDNKYLGKETFNGEENKFTENVIILLIIIFFLIIMIKQCL